MASTFSVESQLDYNLYLPNTLLSHHTTASTYEKETFRFFLTIPLVPDFDLHEALEVPKDASAQDITLLSKSVAKAELRKTMEDAAASMKEKIDIEYKLKTEVTFSANGCVTDAEKEACCEHCYFWPKEQMKKKFKCLTCGQKRGMTQYKCPYCALVLCRLCLGAKWFTKKL
ncbi:putative chaperone domain protein [Botrytis fragariae]|uniref:Putative chaperone domain protein n=1 Tax=Botrytis fragariae TaxID=1964551 RepID=A0A8H6EMZ8_9HELO|nr:putative chaperone domain protein [Botrytis fragariae]KAF5877845.1 putative chaperone domain protein [Botrytis fragariae]